MISAKTRKVTGIDAMHIDASDSVMPSASVSQTLGELSAVEDPDQGNIPAIIADLAPELPRKHLRRTVERALLSANDEHPPPPHLALFCPYVPSIPQPLTATPMLAF